MIESSQNAKIKEVRHLLTQTKYRKASGCFVIESPKVIQELLRSEPSRCQYLLYSDPTMLPKEVDVPSFQVEDALFRQLSSLKTPQGLLAVCQKPSDSFKEKASSLSRVFILDGVQDPQNLGAIIRVALAFSFDAVLCLDKSVDFFHPRVCQASSGGVLNQCLSVLDDQDLHILKAHGFSFYTLDSEGGQSVTQTDFSNKSAIILGSEGQGVRASFWGSFEPKSCRIPISDQMESLNVAVAAGIVAQRCQDMDIKRV
ncbi:hypothetical protein DID77_00105 [Candidatus Marinamargulisbacteria bacterium SCGC AG-439-L15]|nr:hypothetical protein DID77_00105 [Candidatus Marinamargulisbacteria bacterium SCGC AG-439-L15]